MLKFSLRPSELNNWKAGITQRVAEQYIEEILSAKLQKEGFDLSILMKNDQYHFCELMGYSLLTGRFITVKPPRIEELEHTCPISKYTSYLKRVFLNDGVFPSSDLIKKSIRLNSLQEVSTDGRLFRLKKTGKFITKKKAFRGMNPEYRIIRQGKESVLPEQIDRSVNIATIEGKMCQYSTYQGTDITISPYPLLVPARDRVIMIITARAKFDLPLLLSAL